MAQDAAKVAVVTVGVGVGVVAGTADADAASPAPEPNAPEMQRGYLDNPTLRAHIDQNMPEGVVRDFVYVEGKGSPVASVFFLEDDKPNASFYTNDEHPGIFSPEIDYEKLAQDLENDNQELVLAFAGAYKSPSGNIEGVAVESGELVGEQDYSKWHGFLYITPDGSMEMYRMRDAQNKFQKSRADRLVARAQNEGGSMFQQIPAIWNGEKKLFSSSPDRFEWRAIAQNGNGEKLVINSTEKLTQDEFLELCVGLQDESGNQVINDLLLLDTGVYSEGVFRDKDQVDDDSQFAAYPMRDENHDNKRGYTNVVVISVDK